MQAGKDRELEATDRDGFRFRGGHPALDLTATLQGRLKDSPRELLNGPEDLARWLVAAGLASPDVECDAATVRVARELREAVHQLVHAHLAGERPPDRARRVLNQVARRGSAPRQLTAKGEAVLDGDALQRLAFVANEAIALLGSTARGRLRKCENEGCAVLFVDLSRSGARRWCSMAACGNRHMVAEFWRRKT
jgi:predicted RNA-binding Zn ribbon-like protein